MCLTQGAGWCKARHGRRACDAVGVKTETKKWGHSTVSLSVGPCLCVAVHQVFLSFSPVGITIIEIGSGLAITHAPLPLMLRDSLMVDSTDFRTGHNENAASILDCSRLLKKATNEAAGETKPEAYSLGYVEDFVEPRTKLGAFFSSLLEDFSIVP